MVINGIVYQQCPAVGSVEVATIRKTSAGSRTTSVREKLLTLKDHSAPVHLSLDHMLCASHALSIYQNGRTLQLDQYPPPVRRYVSSVLRSGKIDESLKSLNRQIVRRMGSEQ